MMWDQSNTLSWREWLAMPFIAFLGGIFIMLKTVLVVSVLGGLLFLFVQGCCVVVWAVAWVVAALFWIEGVPHRETPWLWLGGNNG